jgi:hypothetical protein
VTGCILHEALGRAEECPGEECALWRDDCAVRGLRIDLLEQKELAAYLLELRERMEELRAS